MPEEPDAYYFIGFLNSQLQRYDEGIVAFRKALAIAPYHASAQFGIARAYQRKGDAENARENMKKFQKISAEKLGSPFGAGYGDQGKYSLAEFVHGADSNAPAEIAVHYVQDSLAKRTTGTAGPGAISGSRGACFIDFDGDGKPDLFLVAAGTGQSLMLHNTGDGKFEDVTEKVRVEAEFLPDYGCSAGDFDNDGKADLAVCETDGVRLFHNEGDGKFADVTQKTGIVREKGCVAATFVDYDHDGDLDLYLTMAPGTADQKNARTKCGGITATRHLPTFPKPQDWVWKQREHRSQSPISTMIVRLILFWRAARRA